MRSAAGAGVLITALLIPPLATACSGDDDAAPVTAPPDTVGADSSPTTRAPDPPATVAPEASAPGSTGPDPSTSPPTTSPPTTGPAATADLPTVPETGIPGLDSDDSFCAAWSRFGGTWQVIQVAANFAPDPGVVPVMEVVAAPVVDHAFDAMFAAWPTELADERDVVASGYFGPLDRRAAVALDALADAGATASDLTALAAAWEAALAARRPDDPVVMPQLPGHLEPVVAAAAADLDARLVGFADDPSMLITAETPRTDAYLATACPDQGALTGGEVEG